MKCIEVTPLDILYSISPLHAMAKAGVPCRGIFHPRLDTDKYRFIIEQSIFGGLFCYYEELTTPPTKGD